MKLLTKDWQHHALLLFLFALIATALLSPIASNFLIPNNLDVHNHLAAIIQAKMALAEGQFPLRIAPLEQQGWRYPLYQFYSPSTYTFAGILFAVLPTTNPFIAYKLTIWCALVMGGLYIYRLTYWFVKSNQAAILTSLVYLTTPYWMIVIHHFFAFNEAVALGIIPAVLYYTARQYCKPFQKKRLLQTGLGWYILATVHLITFIFTSIFAAFLLLLITFKNNHHQRWKNLTVVGIGYLFGCLLAMWHLAPILLFAKYFVVFNPFIVFYNPTLTSLLSFTNNFSGDKNSPITMLITNPVIGLPISIALGISIFALICNLRSGQKRADYWFLPLLAAFAIAFMMTWSPTYFWAWLPRLIGQYSFRLLGQIMWIGALLFAWSICWLFKNKLNNKHTLVGVLLILIATSSWLPIKDTSFINVSDIIKHPIFTFNVDSYLIDETAHPKLIDIKNKLTSSELLTATQVKKYCLLKNEITVCTLNVPASIHTLELPIIYYPKLLKITLNGQPVAYKSIVYHDRLIAGITPQINKANIITIQFCGLEWANFISRIAWGLWLLLGLFITMQTLFSKKKSITTQRIPHAERVSVHLRISFRRPS